MYAYCLNNPVNKLDYDGHFSSGIMVALLVGLSLLLSGCAKSDSVGSAQGYKEIAGSDGNRDTNPNCYSYALGYYDRSYDPGEFSTLPNDYTLYAYANAVESDLHALGRGCRVIESFDSPIKDNEYRIALRVSKLKPIITPQGLIIDWDYHFMVQTETGGWAEKHGPGGATNYHAESDPSTISWDCGAVTGYYTSDIVYFAITY